MRHRQLMRVGDLSLSCSLLRTSSITVVPEGNGLVRCEVSTWCMLGDVGCVSCNIATSQPSRREHKYLLLPMPFYVDLFQVRGVVFWLRDEEGGTRHGDDLVTVSRGGTVTRTASWLMRAYLPVSAKTSSAQFRCTIPTVVVQFAQTRMGMYSCCRGVSSFVLLSCDALKWNAW